MALSRLTAFVGLLGFALSACERPPPVDSLKEWTPADHHSGDDDKLASGMQEQAGGEAPGSERGGTDVVQLVELTWRQQCSACHGALGRGDGQMGPMVKAPDLTREDWQSRVTVAEIAATIRDGKGKMPKFDVPDPVVQGLVARVRATRGR